MSTPDPGRLTDLTGLDRRREWVEPLWQRPGMTVERIVSWGHTTDWLDQDHDEWVMVHAGCAELEFADGTRIRMDAGAHVLLPRRVRHRVAWTDPETPTIWVAVHFADHPR